MTEILTCILEEGIIDLLAICRRMDEAASKSFCSNNAMPAPMLLLSIKARSFEYDLMFAIDLYLIDSIVLQVQRLLFASSAVIFAFLILLCSLWVWVLGTGKKP